MTDLIKRDDALAACDIAPPDEWNDYTKGGYDFAAEECKRNIAVLPALTSNPVDNSKTANPVVNDPAAIPALQARIEELVAELDLMKTAGIIEIASRNNKVTEYMFYWEGRALDAEAKLAKAVEALREIEADCDADYPPSHGASKHAIRATLAELEGK